jgi:lysine-N-methylase
VGSDIDRGYPATHRLPGRHPPSKALIVLPDAVNDAARQVRQAARCNRRRTKGQGPPRKDLPLSAPEIITARYMTVFQCIGGACEDTCCAGWQVHIDSRQYQILKKEMGGSRAEREEFRSSVELETATPASEATYAKLKLKDDHSCSFLDSERLCSVQGRYGEKALPQVCSTYPRRILQKEQRLEVWGWLSCPETARLCLLREDAMDIVDGNTGMAARMEAMGGMAGAPTPYQRYLDDIRGAAFKLLSTREYPISTRLFMLAYLGKQTAEFFHHDVAQVDEARLGTAIDLVCNPETMAVWHRQLASLPAPTSMTANLVTQLLAAKLKAGSGAFGPLVDKITSSYGPGLSLAGQSATAMSLADLWSAYSTRRQAWVDVLPDRVDLYFENYAKNHWMREWYVRSPDLLAYAQRLLVRVALLRFLLFSHPALQEVATADIGVRRETLDRVAVEVFYKFSRAVEHSPKFLDMIAEHLTEQGLVNFGHATILALV